MCDSCFQRPDIRHINIRIIFDGFAGYHRVIKRVYMFNNEVFHRKLSIQRSSFLTADVTYAVELATCVA